MDSKTYIEGVLKTESRTPTTIASRFLGGTAQLEVLPHGANMRTMRLLHAAMGMATEAGEFLDALKKHIFYGKPLDDTNLIEELGDMFWYCGIALDVLKISFEEIMQINHDKLATRYSKGFSEKEATNRDLNKEREVLENSEYVSKK